MSSSKRAARMGDTVQIQYVCQDEDGEVLEDTHEFESVPEVVLGDGSILPVLEEACCGMCEGETKRLTFEPEETFGEYDPDLVEDVPKADLVKNLKCEPEEGMVLTFEDEEGEEYECEVIEVNGDLVTVDANHPLAGETLTYVLSMVSVKGGKH